MADSPDPTDPPSRPAAERLEHDDAELPAGPPKGPPKAPRAGANRYAWAVGIIVIMLGGMVLFTQSLPNAGKGVKGPDVGQAAPAFAAPLSDSRVQCSKSEPCSANVCQRAAECNKQIGSRPACGIRSDQVFNLCQMRRRPLVLTFLATDGADCEPQVDRVERMRRDFPGVGFAAVMGGEGREEVDRIAKRRGWSLPVAVDPDGAVLNLYGVGVCPTTVFIEAGGQVDATKLGNLTEKELRAQIGRIAGT